MQAKATIIKDGKEVVSTIGEVAKPGDLETLVFSVFETARQFQIDLWNFTLQVTKA